MTRHAVAALSLPLRLLAYVAGFDGNSDVGIRLVEGAAQYPGETRRNALFTLVLLYNRESRHDAAMSLIRELQELYPRIACCGSKPATRCCVRAGRPKPRPCSTRGWLDLRATRGGALPAKNRDGAWRWGRAWRR